jgi:hypothetical protein
MRRFNNSTQRLWFLIVIVGLLANITLISKTSRILFANTNTDEDDRPSVEAIQRVIIESLPSLKESNTIPKKTKDPTAKQRQIRQLPVPRSLQPLKTPTTKGQEPNHVVPTKSENNNESPLFDDQTFSFCLLIKDDNDILNEWIAYHYHVLNLRHMIVAVDPSSQTSPIPLLQIWKRTFGVNVTLWTDQDFMPDYFLQGHFELVPRMIKLEDKNATKWQEDDGVEVSEAHRQRDYLEINNHRYRQAKFLQRCSKTLQDAQHTWTTHIDTDEYIAINPTVRRQQGPEEQPPMAGNGTVAVPKALQAGAILKFLNDLHQQDPIIINWPCISMPRILYGSVEDETTLADSSSSVVGAPMFARSKLESLRWKYHADYLNQELNRQPKTIMDVSGFPAFNVSRKAFSIHRPSMHLCRNQGQMNVLDGDRYPLVVHHYVGSFERYKARKDPRRTETAYWQKASVRDGKEDGWIDTWLPSFVEQHGMAKVSKVMRKYMTGNVNVNTKTNSAGGIAESFTTPLELGRVLPLEQDSFSACLLIKDDNDILNEWIAYHYHVLKLRTLVVAMDPSSQTSPSVVLERWRDMMEIEEWTDAVYMPDFFLQKQYHLVPSLIGNMTNSSTSQFHDVDDAKTEEQVRQDLIKVNNHRFRQATFFGSCIKDLRQKNKTWMLHIDTDEYIVLHPKVRTQDHWRSVSLDPLIQPSSILKFLKEAASIHSNGLSYPCISMPRLLFGSKEDTTTTDPDRVSQIPKPFHPTKFETLRWKYHSDYDNDLKLNGKPKVILDLSAIPSKSNFLEEGVFSIHRPGLRMCRRNRDILFDKQSKFPLTVNHYIGSWERYSHRSDARRSRQQYDVNARVTADGKDDGWIDGWVSSFVKEHGIATASRLLAEYTQASSSKEGEEGDSISFVNPEDPVVEDANNTVLREKSDLAKNFDSTKRSEFSACLLVKDDNDILNEWIAYHYHVLGLRYMIVAVDAKSETSPSVLLDKWRTTFGMTIEEWKDELFMPDIYFKKAYHLQPRLVKIKKNKHKWLEGIDDPEVAQEYYYSIQDHRFRQITFLSSCAKKLKEQGRTWMIHIDTDEYVVINPKLRKRSRFNENITIPSVVEPSIVPRLLNQMVVSSWDAVNYPCVSLPRLLFGSIDDDDDNDSSVGRQSKMQTHGYNISRFESLRWKHHADYEDGSLNKQPKVMMDISAIPADDNMFTEGRVFSIHRPSPFLCRTQGQMFFDDVEKYPFSVNHYLGTFDRFGARDDPRRNRKLYDQKANVTGGKENDGWINTWLSSFLQEHGQEKVSELLSDYKSNTQ